MDSVDDDVRNVAVWRHEVVREDGELVEQLVALSSLKFDTSDHYDLTMRTAYFPFIRHSIDHHWAFQFQKIEMILPMKGH